MIKGVDGSLGKEEGGGGRKKISKAASLENKIGFPITGYLLAQVAR